ncbi:aldo/keto reductase [Arthrobacter sp. JZ12]|uniref:aldo/keto reductase n=1 Tax=Arthrobacter sp. JZ12 TaxID=2654190 RepID=UPI002B4A1AAF|nr:aldo/keto reductase [Arthrobacter sp. JZ12]WRH25325.1 aldo/keto reductase [Arthrobacter sp. JZ12]
MTVPNLTLNDGVEMPALGFGVFLVPDVDAEGAVLQALEKGYRHIDTAAAYENEAGVGRAIARSGIAREDIFVTTKLWIQDAGETHALDAFERSRVRLGVEQVDLLLIHQPFGDYYGTWRAMEDLYRRGQVRAIGVSNFYPDRLVDLIDHNEIVPAVNQIETHPFFQRSADQAVMRSRGVQLESWGPLGQGREDLFTNPILTEIAQTHEKTVAQVVLRWLLQREIAVIPKTVNPARMAENLDVFDFVIADDEMARIATLDTGASTAFNHHDPSSASMLGTTRFDT